MIVTCRQCSSGSIDDLLIDAVTQPYCSILPILSITTSLSCVFSEHGDNTGDVFAVLFNADDRQRFQISNIVIGQGIIIIKPQLEGEWRGIQIVHTPEPCLPGDTNWMPFLPTPFPDRVSIFCRLPCLPVIF